MDDIAINYTLLIGSLSDFIAFNSIARINKKVNDQDQESGSMDLVIKLTFSNA